MFLLFTLFLLVVKKLSYKLGKSNLLHFERNYFTGVNRLTPQTELLHTSKNEVKVIPSLPAQVRCRQSQLGVPHLVEIDSFKLLAVA